MLVLRSTLFLFHPDTSTISVFLARNRAIYLRSASCVFNNRYVDRETESGWVDKSFHRLLFTLNLLTFDTEEGTTGLGFTERLLL